MYISRVVLKDIKGFRELDLSLAGTEGEHAGWTVITGDNASGKTALLRAIAIALVGPDVARVLLGAPAGWVRQGGKVGEIAVQIVPHEEDKFRAGRRHERALWCELEVSTNGGGIEELTPGRRRRGKVRGPMRGPWDEGTDGWFSAGYGPFRRLYGTSPEAQRLMSRIDSPTARFGTLFKEEAALGDGELWLKDLQHKQLEKKQRAEATLSAVLAILNAEFLRNGVRVERVDSDGLWLRDGAGTVLSLRDMSEGYRAALGMMIDILRQLDHAFPDRPLLAEGEEQHAVQHRGVVLIDEVDAHLHPEWQRLLGPWLTGHFPNLQFIVTTHSPLVCQAASHRRIYHLPPPASGRPPFQLSEGDYWKLVRSTADDVLLTPAFGLAHTRSIRAVDARQRHAALRAKERGPGLTREEQQHKRQLEMFIDPEADA